MSCSWWNDRSSHDEGGEGGEGGDDKRDRKMDKPGPPSVASKKTSSSRCRRTSSTTTTTLVTTESFLRALLDPDHHYGNLASRGELHSLTRHRPQQHDHGTHQDQPLHLVVLVRLCGMWWGEQRA